jgi:hypothetical protein
VKLRLKKKRKDIVTLHTLRSVGDMGFFILKASASLSSSGATFSMSSRLFSSTKASISAGTSSTTTFSLQRETIE